MKQKSEDSRRKFLVEALSLGLFAGVSMVDVVKPGHAMGTFTKKLPPGRSIYKIKGDVSVDGKPADLIIRKGFRREIDSYSAFFENDHTTPTRLDGYLKSRGVDTVTLVGLATDFCVNYSAVDAAKLGFKVTVIESLCRAIDFDGSLDAAKEGMTAAGVTLA